MINDLWGQMDCIVNNSNWWMPTNGRGLPFGEFGLVAWVRLCAVIAFFVEIPAVVAVAVLELDTDLFKFLQACIIDPYLGEADVADSYRPIYRL